MQFETIHPFLDGNGRLGRLLITLLLCVEKVMTEPLLYLSLYFKQNRQKYYDHLQRVRLEGDWLGWLRFFMTGVQETADQAGTTTGNILYLFNEDRQKIEGLGRWAASAHRIHRLLQRTPVLTVPSAAAHLDVTAPTARSAVKNLEKLEIVREITGKRRDRIYVYDQYMKILDEGTEPLPLSAG